MLVDCPPTVEIDRVSLTRLMVSLRLALREPIDPADKAAIQAAQEALRVV